MNATITLTKAVVTQAEVQQVIAKASTSGWTVEWTVHEVQT